jgi:hypothetical protein
MSNRPLRDELKDVFDSLSEPAHPAFAHRVRSEIEQRSARPAPRAPRLAVALAALVAVAVVAGLLLAGRHGIVLTPSPAATATAAPHPAPTATPIPAVGPAATLSPPAPGPSGTPPGFSCSAQSGGSGGSGVTGVRAGPQTGYDRFVIQFDGPVPPYQVTPQGNASFVQDPKGTSVTLKGSAGLKVVIHGVANWTSLPGPAQVQPSGTSVLREARQVGDFEGVVSWGLGLSHASCFHAYTLTGPNRLVIDVQD